MINTSSPGLKPSSRLGSCDPSYPPQGQRTFLVRSRSGNRRRPDLQRGFCIMCGKCRKYIPSQDLAESRVDAPRDQIEPTECMYLMCPRRNRRGLQVYVVYKQGRTGHIMMSRQAKAPSTIVNKLPYTHSPHSSSSSTYPTWRRPRTSRDGTRRNQQIMHTHYATPAAH